ncbi:ATP-binding protein [Streptomyces sp. NPDC002935]|uniref:ATP-binding protein n=1 Tax=unclassified Streptomyces TaxID=2593676 RepID=UPI00332BAA0F
MSGGYRDNAEHLADELCRLDLLGERDMAGFDELSAEIETRVDHGLAEGVWLGLPLLGRLFGLGSVELLAVVACLAPDLRDGYERPGPAALLQLLWPDERARWVGRNLLDDSAPLLRMEVLRQNERGEWALDPRIRRFLLGSPGIDVRLRGSVRRHSPAGLDTDLRLVNGLLRLIDHHWSGDERPTLVFELRGAEGTAGLAGEVCARLGVPLLEVDLAERTDLVRAAVREGLLQRGGVHLSGAGPAHLLRTAVADFGWLVFLMDGDLGELPGVVVHRVTVPPPDPAHRAAAWRAALGGHEEWADELAGRFRLPPSRIRAAAQLAEQRRIMAGEPGEPTLADLTEACRAESQHRLGPLAAKVTPRAGWDDLVLPADRLELLADIRDQIRHHHRVHTDWGFGERTKQGLSALFSGPSGTGKTMAAEVLAGDLGLDLYKVDLSGVVSKYIGETEKNLARLFAEAAAADAILFFDEADALFGKRTEVSDAHDRYANIETSYLLQKLEEHDGPVILATNLRQNLDEAFTRRIRFTVEFPFPEADSRLRIWHAHFPVQAPVAPDLDLGVLARNFPVSGGSIHTIVLNAAFLAAADGGVIRQGHLLRGTRREYDKIGRLWPERRAS